MTTSWARWRASSFVMACWTWVRTVSGLRYIRSAISSLDSPSATWTRTSRSHAVRTSRARAAVLCRSGCARKASDERPGRCGDSRVSPAAIVRMARSSSAGPTSLPRNLLAPARSARATYSSSSNVVRIRTCAARRDSSQQISFVAAKPSRPGIRMSINTTSGCMARTVFRLPRRRQPPYRRRSRSGVRLRSGVVFRQSTDARCVLCSQCCCGRGQAGYCGREGYLRFM